MSENLVHQKAIVVGVDATESSRAAQEFALAEAKRRGMTLRLVSAYQWGREAAVPALAAGVPVDAMAALRNEAEDALVAAIDRLRSEAEGVQIEHVTSEGSAVEILLEQAKSAFLVVVGSRHLSVSGAFFLGSVGATVATKAHCPVIVLRGPEGIPGENPAIIAAVDGTARSEDVLAFAFDEASRSGRPVQAVSCWMPPATGWDSSTLVGATERIYEEARVRLSEAVAGWREKYPDVSVTEAVVEAHPVAGLVEKSYGQSLLVVGRGSKHPRVGAIFGSTSQGVLHHAMCPVAVVGES